MKKYLLLLAFLVLVPGSVFAASPAFIGQPKTQGELLRCEIVKSKYSGKVYKKGDKAIKTMAAKWALCLAPEKPKAVSNAPKSPDTQVAPVPPQKTTAQIQLETEANNLALYGNPLGPVVPTSQTSQIVRAQTPDTITLVDSRNVITENRVREIAREEIITRETELSVPAPIIPAPVVDRTAPEVQVNNGKLHGVCDNCIYLKANEPITATIKLAPIVDRQLDTNDIRTFEVTNLEKEHRIAYMSLPRFKVNTKYLFKVEARDEAGNVFLQQFTGSHGLPVEWGGTEFIQYEEIPVARMEIVDGPRREEDPVYRHSFCVYLKDSDGNNIITNEFVGVRESQSVDRSLNILRDRIASQCYPLKYDFRTEGKTTLTFTAGDVVKEVIVEAYRRGENGVLTEVR